MAYIPDIDLDNVEPSKPREILPAGTYPVQIVESDVQPAKSGHGTVLALTFEVLDGAHAGRKLWANLNVLHANPTAQEIAQRDLKAICVATGVRMGNDTEVLHFKPLSVKVEVELKGTKGSNGYEAKSDRNVVKGYEALGSRPAAEGPAPRQATRPAAVQQAAPVQQASAPAARPAAMPWKRTA